MSAEVDQASQACCRAWRLRSSVSEPNMSSERPTAEDVSREGDWPGQSGRQLTRRLKNLVEKVSTNTVRHDISLYVHKSGLKPSFFASILIQHKLNKQSQIWKKQTFYISAPCSSCSLSHCLYMELGCCHIHGKEHTMSTEVDQASQASYRAWRLRSSVSEPNMSSERPTAEDVSREGDWPEDWKTWWKKCPRTQSVMI